MLIYLSFLVFIFITCTNTFSFGFTARVASIPDGDTIEVYKKGERVRTVIDLYGIDCPERQQSFGRHAWEATSNMVSLKTVWIEHTDAVGV